MKTNREVEIKLCVENLHELLSTLKRLGAQCLGSVHEENTLFDTKRHDFQRQGSILRIRQEDRAGAPGASRSRGHRSKSRKGLLTFKGRVAGDRGGKYKVREEIEYRTANVLRLKRILSQLGIRPWFRYEKYRTRYRLQAFPTLEIDLDETPIGVFIELEGPKRAIDRAARQFGYSPRDYLAVSYLGLYVGDCITRGHKPGNMVF